MELFPCTAHVVSLEVSPHELDTKKSFNILSG